MADPEYSSLSNDKTTLNTGMDITAMCHELGHVVDIGTSLSEGKKIYEDEELLDIYHKEFEEFNKKYPDSIGQIVEYFSPKHDTKKYAEELGNNAPEYMPTGINEFIAETNMLMSTYGGSGLDMPTRSWYLVQYFPKTVAKIVELLG